MKRLKLIYLLISLWLYEVNCELYTAIAGLKPLLRTHQDVIQNIHNYLEKEAQKFEYIHKQYEIYKSEHEKAMADIDNYLGNPINAFTLIKRLTVDLDKIESYIHIATDHFDIVRKDNKETPYPTEEDLSGAAIALARLQETYKLDTREIAEGKLNGVVYSAPMSASDCLEVGRNLYDDEEYDMAVSWLKEALHKLQLEEEENKTTCSKADILQNISNAYFQLDELEKALYWSKKILLIDPHYPHASNVVARTHRLIHDNLTQDKKKVAKEVKKLPEDIEAEEYKVTLKNAQALCRGEVALPPNVTKNFKCRYASENHPFLKLAPFKLEEMYLNPYVYVFHDVISDKEMEEVKALATPQLDRARVRVENGGSDTSRGRISQLAWLSDQDSKLIATLSKRVADMTGLSLLWAELFQVVNYGIGGHYNAHYDFTRENETKDYTTEEGNRIATVLYYIAEVEQGGATVFPELGIRVPPEKGSAVFWMNLQPSGHGDYLSLHQACPVLRGSKWVCNKWFHEGGQELRRPCNLTFKPEGPSRKVPVAVPVSAL